MPQQVSMTAQLTCSFGSAPSQLVVLPADKVLAENNPAATIMDHVPLLNILPFGMCSSLANPVVAAATAAAMGALTPMPCIPATGSPWVPGAATVVYGNKPALDNTCKCFCNWTGIITVAQPATTKTQIP